MTDASLFHEMNEIADALLRNDPDLCDSRTYECWFEFRQLTRRRMPQLDEAERRELFEQWLTHDRHGGTHASRQRVRSCGRISTIVREPMGRGSRSCAPARPCCTTQRLRRDG